LAFKGLTPSRVWLAIHTADVLYLLSTGLPDVPVCYDRQRHLTLLKIMVLRGLLL